MPRISAPTRRLHARDTQLLKTAYHEAGHIVVAWHFDLEVRSATIEPEGNAAGSVRVKTPRGITLGVIDSDKARVHGQNYVAFLLAGIAAERKHAPQSRWREHGAPDYFDAWRMAGELNDSENARCAFFNWQEIVAEELVERLWPQVETVAKALLEGRTLTGDDLRRVISASR